MDCSEVCRMNVVRLNSVFTSVSTYSTNTTSYKKKYIKGWSPIKNTDFSLTEFGGELDRYLESYESIKRILSELNILYSVQQL